MVLVLISTSVTINDININISLHVDKGSSDIISINNISANINISISANIKVSNSVSINTILNIRRPPCTNNSHPNKKTERRSKIDASPKTERRSKIEASQNNGKGHSTEHFSYPKMRRNIQPSTSASVLVHSRV